METIVSKITDIAFGDIVSAVERQKIHYVITVVLNELSKFLLMAVLFIALGRGVDFVLAYFACALLRIHLGGFHFSGYWQCLLFSTGYFGVVITLNQLTLSSLLIMAFGAYSVMLVYVLAPVLSSAREETVGFAKRRQLKYKATLIATFYSALPVFIGNARVGILVWTLIVQAGLIVIKEVYHEFVSQ